MTSSVHSSVRRHMRRWTGGRGNGRERIVLFLVLVVLRTPCVVSPSPRVRDATTRLAMDDIDRSRDAYCREEMASKPDVGTFQRVHVRSRRAKGPSSIEVEEEEESARDTALGTDLVAHHVLSYMSGAYGRTCRAVRTRRRLRPEERTRRDARVARASSTASSTDVLITALRDGGSPDAAYDAIRRDLTLPLPSDEVLHALRRFDVPDRVVFTVDPRERSCADALRKCLAARPPVPRVEEIRRRIEEVQRHIDRMSPEEQALCGTGVLDRLVVLYNGLPHDETTPVLNTLLRTVIREGGDVLREVRVLVAAGADPGASGNNVVRMNALTLELIYVDERSSAIVRRLLPAMSGLQIGQDTHDGQTALHDVIKRRGPTDVLDQLLARCPTSRLGYQDYFGETALHVAASQGRADAVRRLLRYMTPAQVERCDRWGRTALQRARSLHHESVVSAIEAYVSANGR